MSETRGLNGKAAVVTGGAKGMGRGISLAFARAGADLAIISRTAKDLNTVSDEIKKLGGKALTYCGDISIEEDVAEFIDNVIEKFGRIDFLVNNAASFLAKKVDETTLDEWQKILSVNLTGTFLVTRAVVEQMKKQRSGRIFTISSVGGRTGLSGKAAYCATKFGVAGFSKALAKELREYGIKVQIMYPYHVDSYGKIDWSKESDEQLSAIKAEDLADMLIYHASLPLRVLTEDIVFDPYMR